MYNYIYTLNNLIKNIIEIFIYDSDKLNSLWIRNNRGT